jgi:hypothetical protein
MTTIHPDLAKQIEDLVRQHVDALRASATAPVASAFAAAPAPSSARASTSPQPVRPRRKPAARRAPEELLALGERFYAVVCQRPGETMMTLAAEVGVAPRVLQVAVARLRRDGCVRVIGKKQQTRYYPMAMSPSSTATLSAAVAA